MTAVTFKRWLGSLPAWVVVVLVLASCFWLTVVAQLVVLATGEPATAPVANDAAIGPPCGGRPDSARLQDDSLRFKAMQDVWNDGWRDICARHGDPSAMSPSEQRRWEASTRTEIERLRAKQEAAKVAYFAEAQESGPIPRHCLSGEGSQATWELHDENADGSEPASFFCDRCREASLQEHGDNSRYGLHWRRL